MKKVLVLSDMHVNSLGGLLHPKDDIQDIKEYDKYQRLRRKFWNVWSKEVKKNGPYNSLVLLGELLDVPHSMNFKNTVYPKIDLPELSKFVTNVIDEIPLKNNAIVIGCLGSRWHVTLEQLFEVEKIVYSDLKSKGYTVIENLEEEPIDFMVNDVLIRAWHKINGTYLRNIDANIIKETTKGERAPDILLSGHLHKGESFKKQYANRTFEFIRCPALSIESGGFARMIGHNETFDANSAVGFNILEFTENKDYAVNLITCDVREARKIVKID